METIYHVSYLFLQRWEAKSETIFFIYFHCCGTWSTGKDNLECVVMCFLVSLSPLCKQLYDFFRGGGLLNNVMCVSVKAKGGGGE